MHAKVGDRVRTESGRSGIVTAYTERPDGGWTVDVTVDDEAGRPVITLPYDASDLTVVEAGATDGHLHGATR
jgi:hypothetical protein